MLNSQSSSTQIVPFSYQGSEVRSVIMDGEPYFVAKDVCNVLGIKNSRHAVSRLDADEVRVSLLATPSGEQRYQLVTESGLYHLVFTSTLAEAKVFRKWVTAEVLPAIRKTGKYETVAAAPPQLADGSVQLKADLEALFELGGHGAKGRLCDALLESGAINRAYIQEFLNGKRQLTFKQAEKLHQRVIYLLTIHKKANEIGQAWLPLLERFTPSDLMGYAYGQKQGFFTPYEPLLTALFTAAQDLNERLLMVSPSKTALA